MKWDKAAGLSCVLVACICLHFPPPFFMCLPKNAASEVDKKEIARDWSTLQPSKMMKDNLTNLLCFIYLLNSKQNGLL